MEVYVKTDDRELHKNIKADSRGRITLGKEYADEVVSVAVVSREGEEVSE